MATEIRYRKADISTADARKSLKRAYPGAKIASIEVVPADADAASAARVSIGDLVYEAKVVTADFPPEGDGGDSDDSGEDSAPPKKEKSDSSDSDSGSDDGGDDGGDSDGGNPFGGGDDGGEGGEPKLKGDDGIIHLLTEILHAVKGGGGLGAPDPGLDGPGGPGLDGPPAPGGAPGLPDVGAPPAGGPPLPPPVHEKAPMGGPAFASVNKTEFSILRRDAHEITNTAIQTDLHSSFPAYKVARIQRTGSAKVNGIEVNLKSNDFAVVTLIKK